MRCGQPIKIKLKNTFNRASRTYDLNCELQRHIAQLLIAKVLTTAPSKTVNKILELGCGTGESTQYLKAAFEPSDVFLGLDLSEKFLSILQKKPALQAVQVICGDFDNLPIDIHNIDLLFANMSLQWSLKAETLIKNLKKYVKKSGVFAFSVPVIGTFEEIQQQHRNEFYDINQWCDKLNTVGWQVKAAIEHSFIQEFSTPIKALNSIKAIGANCLMMPKLIDKKLKQKLTPIFYDENNCQLTYRIAFIIAKNESEYAFLTGE